MGPRTLPPPPTPPQGGLQRCQGLHSLISPLQGDSPLANSVPGLVFPTMSPFYTEDLAHRIEGTWGCAFTSVKHLPGVRCHLCFFPLSLLAHARQGLLLVYREGN